MCELCRRYVRDHLGLTPTDIEGMTYTVVKWRCIVPDCGGHVRVRDYGLECMYFWPVPVRITKEGWWRCGGWLDASSHWLYCAKHWKQYAGPDTLQKIPEEWTHFPLNRIQAYKKK